MVVVLLMDTQGTSDSQFERFSHNICPWQNDKFNIGIYPIPNVQEDDLQNLQLFAEYG